MTNDVEENGKATACRFAVTKDLFFEIACRIVEHHYEHKKNFLEYQIQGKGIPLEMVIEVVQELKKRNFDVYHTTNSKYSPTDTYSLIIRWSNEGNETRGENKK